MEHSSTSTRDGPLTRLTTVSRALTYAHSLDEVLEIAVDTAGDLLEAPRVVLMLREDDGLLRIRAARGVDPETVERFREPLDETLISRLSAIFGPEAETRFLGVPLVVRGRVTGLLAVLQREERQEARDEWLLSALADQASVALEGARREVTSSSLKERLRAVEEQEEQQEHALRIMSHDVTAPLHAVRGYVDLLEAEIYGPLTDDQRRVLDRLDTVTGHLDSLIANALEMSRLQAGRVPVECVPVRIREVVDDAVAIVGLRAREEGISIRAPVPRDLVARADAARLRQVLVHLLDNALRYAPPDSEVRIAGTSESGSRDEVLIRVADEGPGIDAGEAEAIFEPYEQLEEASDGSGLGLSIARATVELMEGELTLENPGCDGATFLIRLPAA